MRRNYHLSNNSERGITLTLLSSMLEYNKNFVENKDYEQYVTSKVPAMKAVLLTCMDTRLQELSTKALGLKMVMLRLLKMPVLQLLILMDLQCVAYLSVSMH